ncbi:MAG: hypothetical protein J6A15_02145 [Clostridia bacterium]|nr:hypothetical protein [Clostridia bacterium]
MTKATLRKSLLSDISNVENQVQEAKFHLLTFDDTYSDSDEYPYSKEDLENCLDTLKETLKHLNRELKEIEKI